MLQTLRKGVLIFATVMMLAAPFYILTTPKQAHAQVCLAAAAGWVLGLFGAHTAATDAALATLEAQIPLTVPVNDLAMGGFGLVNSLGQSVGGGIEAITAWKECVLDPLLWLAKSILIEAITTAIVDWINSGFEGSPVFVTDLDGFMLDVADKVAGDFITENGLQFLCSPFQIDVQIKLLLSYYSTWGSEGTYCKLSDIVTNIDNFLSGDFFDGGWPAWASMSMYPSGNPNGSFLKAAGELQWRISSKTGEESDLFARAFNFLSPRDKNGNIVTPGKYVENELTSWNDSPLAQLAVADEVDEIIGALFSYLTQEILTGENGLRGVSDGYTNRIRDGQRQACLALQQDLVAEINELIASEQALNRTQFIEKLNDLLTRAQAVPCTLFPEDTTNLKKIQSELETLKAQINGTAPACKDMIDNDGDGKTDYPNDPGCTSATDNDETDDGGPGDPPPPVYQCSDGLDNDGDEKTDYPNDPDCTGTTDNSEAAEAGGPGDPPAGLPAICADSLDNDGDGKTDYPNDPGCTSATDNDETDSAAPACSDTIDNDGDGKTDYPNDPGCTGTADTDETDAAEPPPPPAL